MLTFLNELEKSGGSPEFQTENFVFLWRLCQNCTSSRINPIAVLKKVFLVLLSG